MSSEIIFFIIVVFLCLDFVFMKRRNTVVFNPTNGKTGGWIAGVRGLALS